jgi:hypothetical protein
MKLFSAYIEAKEAVINKLDWTDAQKKQIQELVNKYPQKASKIDWNKNDLTFNYVLAALQETSKKDIKSGNIAGLKLGIDYLDVSTDTYKAYIPLNYAASRVIANKKIGGVEGKWCIADQNTREHWDVYINNIPPVNEDELTQLYDAELESNMDFDDDEAPEFDGEDYDNWLIENWDEIIANYPAYKGAILVIIAPGKLSTSGAAYNLETNEKVYERKFKKGDMHKLAIFWDAEQAYSPSVAIWDEHDNPWDQNDVEIHMDINVDKIKIDWGMVRNKIQHNTDYAVALRRARQNGLPY